MNEKINITKMDGTSVAADIICFIENVNTNKRYVYYTLNEIVGAGPNSTVKIYVSKLKQDNPALDTPISEDDWNTLKGYMGDSLKGTANVEIKYIPLSELGTPVSVSERAIAMPTNYDYINKQRGLYAQSVATAGPTTTPTSEPIAEVTPTEQLAAPVATPEVPAAETPVPTVDSTPATETPTEETSNVFDTPAAPTAPAQVEPTPVTETPAVEEPAPVTEPTPVVSPVAAPIETTDDTTTDEGSTGTAIKLEPIDLSTIEAKYAEMIEEINKLKEKELEAAKRYNATIELSAMHSEQHANYVQNDLKESLAAQEATIAASEIAPTPVAPVMDSPAPLAPDMSPTPEVQPIPAAPTIEPTPVTPVVPESAPAAPQDLETNWFDMPNNQ